MHKPTTRLALAFAATAIAAPSFAQDLTFWSWRQEDRAEYERFIEMFNQDHPDINVTFETFEATNYNTILSTALTGGTGPDLMMVRAYGGLEQVASGGYLMALDEESVPAVADFPQSALAAETMRSDETLYAVPFASQTMLVIDNKDIFDQLGLEEPQTWDEMIAASQAIEDAGMFAFANGTATAWQNETIVGALTSSIMGTGFYEDLKAGNADFTDERFVEALAKLQEASEYFPDGFIGLDYASAQQLFTSGMAGMFAGGSFEIANFLGQNPDLNMGVFAAPGVAAEDDKLVGLFYDGGYAVNADTEHPEAALAFVNFLASQEFGQEFANSLRNVTPIPGVTFEDELLGEIAELNETSIPYMMLVDFRYGEPTGSVLLQQEVQKLLAGETTPEAAGAAITEGLATWYEPFQD